MCGIAGYIHFQHAPEEEILHAMERSLTHRGPDEGRIWREGPCGLAHRRLKVIDLSTDAGQPMTNEDGKLHLVFNGEIYNFHELRAELLKRGHIFRSQSDSEVILHGYESWGNEVFGRLRGMFAIALWDSVSGSLVLARDRLGKKPLFYASGSDWIAFGSELSVFKHVPSLKLSISTSAFAEYMEFGYVAGRRTILNEVHRLEAGTVSTWSKGGVEFKKFWSLPSIPPALPAITDRGYNVVTAAEVLEPVLRECIAARLVSDVPLGCFLSGGVDSSLVAALAQESGPKLKTYTVDFSESPQSEALSARVIAAHLGTEHHELEISSADLLKEFESILSRIDEPLGDDSFIPTYLISRETRKYVTVALTGDGGDELFCGYQKYKWFNSIRTIPGGIVPGWLSHLPLGDRVQKAIEVLKISEPMERARWLSSLWKRGELGKLVRQTEDPSAGQLFSDRWNARSAFPEIERWMLADMETYMEANILTKVDRASMAVGLEARSPFLDHRFVEAALQWRCRAQPYGGGKEILKLMLEKRVPRKLFDRPKQGFGLPLDDWYRGPLKAMLLRYTSRSRMESRGLLNAEYVQQVVQMHVSGQRNYARKLHAIVAFEIWADGFFRH